MTDKDVAIEIRTAIKSGDIDTVRQLLGSDSQRLGMTTVFGTWLHVAAMYGKLEIVKFLVDLGADLNAIGGLASGPPLLSAIDAGHSDVAEYLIHRGTTLNVDDSEKNPLLSAIYHGHTEIAKMLINHGIDIQREYGEGERWKNALKLAETYGRTEIAAALRARGAVIPGQPAATTRTGTDDSAQVIAWFEAQFGPSALQLVQPLPTEPNIKVHAIRATPQFPVVTLFTTGLSHLPMTVPQGHEACRLAELFIQLPADWQFENLEDARWHWPVLWLRQLALYPREHRTWLGYPVTIVATDNPPVPLARNTRMDSLMLMAQYKIPLSDGSEIQPYRLLPLYPEERLLERTDGLQVLMNALDQSEAGLVVQLDRTNSATK
jgi:hypothetical protein